MAWDPVRLGPSWATDEQGRFILPRRTLGWHVLAWTSRYLQAPLGGSWTFTPEQARLVLWWYAVDDDGRFVHDDGVLQRLKGWGKDPFAAALAAVEFVGPCRPNPSGATITAPDGTEHPTGVPHRQAWVQVAAVSKDQTRNTMTLFPSLFTRDALDTYSIDLGKEIIYAHHGACRIEAVTSSPRALEGGRPTFVIANETHHWLANNEGHAMWEVIDRNSVKVGSRALAITNAYEPSEDSVAQRTREAWEASEAGQTVAKSRTMYDSLEAHPDAPLTPEAAPEVVLSVRGDSYWLDPVRIVASIMDPRIPPSRSRRFWYNQVTATEDAWVTPQDWDTLARPELALQPGDQVSLFFDGSKSDDATGLVACRISDGFIATLGMWQRPPGDRGKDWTTPRPVVDEAVSRAFDRYRVVTFYADPSHTRDDETQERYWDALIDEWHRRWRDSLAMWATPGRDGHAVMWDMTSPARLERFTAAAERTAQDITEGTLSHDGDPRLRIHVRNARRYVNRYGVSIWKGARDSQRKIDLAVCAVGARMARRDYLNNGKAKPRTGVVHAA